MISNIADEKLRGFNFWLNVALGCVTVVLGLLVYGYLLHSFTVLNESARIETRKYKELVQQAAEISETRHILAGEFATAKQAASALATRIPVAPHESDFLHQVSKVAQETGLEIADYHPGTVDTYDNHCEMEVKFTAKGEYPALCRFLDKTSDLPRLCRLVHLQVTTRQVDPGLDVDMAFKIHFQPHEVSSIRVTE
ncbi:MAG: hypothetical protein JWN70_6250 [Planctomycetaceae bacterium]|nr:hypothetical protein [Planctomycetaceae bacterium]